MVFSGDMALQSIARDSNRVANWSGDTRVFNFFTDPRSLKMQSLSRGVAIFLGIMELCSGSLTKLEKDAGLDRGSIGVAIGGLFLLAFLAVEDGAFADEGTVFDGDNIESIGESFFLRWLPPLCLCFLPTELVFFFFEMGGSLGVSFLDDGAMIRSSSLSSCLLLIDLVGVPVDRSSCSACRSI